MADTSHTPIIANSRLMREEINKLQKVLRVKRPLAPVIPRTSKAQDLIINRLESSRTASSSVSASQSNSSSDRELTSHKKWTHKLPIPNNIADKSFYAQIVQNMHIEDLCTSSQTQETGNTVNTMDVDGQPTAEGISAQSDDSGVGTMEVDGDTELKDTSVDVSLQPSDAVNAMDIDGGEELEKSAEAAREPNVEESSKLLKRKKSWDSEGESELDRGAFDLELNDESSNEESSEHSDHEGGICLRPQRAPKIAQEEPAVSTKRCRRKKTTSSKKSGKGKKDKEDITPQLDDTFDPKVRTFLLHK